MKKILLFLTLITISFCNAQSSIRTVNSGSIVSPTSQISIGEIVINPVSANQSSSGIIGILVQIKQQTLEVKRFDLTNNFTVYPNPTLSKLYFEGNQNIQNQEVFVYNQSGQLVLTSKIALDNSLNLETIASGVYLLQFSDKNIKSFKFIIH